MKNKKFLTIPLSLCLFTSHLNAMMEGDDGVTSPTSSTNSLNQTPFIELVIQAQSKVDNLRTELGGTSESNREEKLLEVQHRLLKLLHFHKSEVGEDLSNIPDTDKKKVLNSLSEPLHNYYQTLLTQIPRNKVDKFKKALDKTIEDHPTRNRSTHIRRAAMIFCSLELPKVVNDSFQALFNPARLLGDKNPDVERLLTYKYGLSDGAVLMLLLCKGLSEKSVSQLSNYFNNLSFYLEFTLSMPVSLWIIQGGSAIYDELPSESSSTHETNVEHFRESLNKLSTPITEEADKELEQLYADIIYKSIEKLNGLSFDSENLESLSPEDHRNLLMAYAGDIIYDYFTLGMANQHTMKVEITQSCIPDLVTEQNKQLFDLAAATKKRVYRQRSFIIKNT